MTDRQRISSGSPFEGNFGYCRAIRIGDRILVSGTAPIWPDGSVDADAYVQAKRCFEIIAKALADAGASLDQVVRTRMYVTGLAWVDAVGKAHGEAMANARPVATMVVVKDLIDERWKVEIEAEAVIS
ncbi:MAG: RidA family protein [Chloroflexi bacterium]|nr:MAG: RidA family protein [Chloroflexota bacterium]